MLCRLFKQVILEPELYEKALYVPDCSSAFMQHKYGLLLKRIVLPSPLSWPCDSPSFMQPPDLVNRSESSCWKKPMLHAGVHRREIVGIRVTFKWTFSCALVKQGVCECILVNNVLTHKTFPNRRTGIN